MKTKFDNRMSFCMRKTPEGLSSFIEYWAGIYKDSIEHRYENNIDKDLNSENIFELYHWKYGQKPTSENHQRTINNNYVSYLSKYKSCPPTQKELKVEYLNHLDKKGTAPVWNIFFLHVLSMNKNFNKNLNKYVYPIFDQHVYRAMYFIQPKDITQPKLFRELSSLNEQSRFTAYETYRDFYQNIEHDINPYLNKGDDKHGRKIDRALFCFGEFLIKG